MKETNLLSYVTFLKYSNCPGGFRRTIFTKCHSGVWRMMLRIGFYLASAFRGRLYTSIDFSVYVAERLRVRHVMGLHGI